MDREYKNATIKNPTFFVGREVENTLLKDHETLFVVGQQSDESISNWLARPECEYVTHIYFAANHSYDRFTDFAQIQRFLDKGLHCTYECTADQYKTVEGELSKITANHDTLFVIMISVVIPNINEVNKPNTQLAIKIDDTDTNRNNPGIWCVGVNTLLSEGNYTDFSEYSGDVILE